MTRKDLKVKSSSDNVTLIEEVNEALNMKMDKKWSILKKG